MDECITNGSKAISPKFLQSVKILGAGTKDPVIIDYALKSDCAIMTNDFGVVSRLVMKGKPAIWRDVHEHTGDFLVMAMPIEKIELCDPVTLHLVRNHSVIAP